MALSFGMTVMPDPPHRRSSRGWRPDEIAASQARGVNVATRTAHMNVDYDLFEGEPEMPTQPGHGRLVPRSLTTAAPVRA